MSSYQSINFGERSKHAIHIGGIFSSPNPAVVRTVLGSCIAVCLHDPVTKVGGMNHFMLPHTADDEGVNSRYGVHAMELLINDCMHDGADRRRLEAKVFGGGHVLKIRETADNVPQINIKFALNFLHTESIPILSRDLGGYSAREVIFFTDTGKTLLRRLKSTGMSCDPEFDEKEIQQPNRVLTIPDESPSDNITLF